MRQVFRSGQQFSTPPQAHTQAGKAFQSARNMKMPGVMLRQGDARQLLRGFRQETWTLVLRLFGFVVLFRSLGLAFLTDDVLTP
jgi:hypothetical protein